MKNFLAALSIIASSTLSASIPLIPSVDEELNSLNFTTEQYKLDLNSTQGLTTFLIKDNEENDDLEVWFYDPTGRFKYDSNMEYNITYFYHNLDVSFSYDEWKSHIGFESNKSKLSYLGCSSNKTITKWNISNISSRIGHNLELYRMIEITHLFVDDYTYNLYDHFALSPIDEYGNSSLQYTQENVVLLSDINVYGYAIDEYDLSFWDKYFTGNFKKGIYYFYGFNVSNYDVEEIYEMDIEYQSYENAEVYLGTKKQDSAIVPDFSKYQDRLIQSLGDVKTTTVTLKADKYITTSDKVNYKSYSYKFNEVDTVTNLLSNSSDDPYFNSFISSNFSKDKFICNFAKYDVDINVNTLSSSFVNSNKDWVYSNCAYKTVQEYSPPPLSILVSVNHWMGCKLTTPEIRNVNALRLKFKSDGEVKDLPVKTAVHEGPSDIGDSPEENSLSWIEYLLELIKKLVAWIIDNWEVVIGCLIILFVLIVVVKVIKK